MSQRRSTIFKNDIDRMMTGMEVQETVDLTVTYIRKTQKFDSPEDAYSWWNMQSDDDKLEILKKALGQ